VKLSRYPHAKEKRYSFHSFLTSALGGMSSQRHAPAAFYLGERTPPPSTHCTGSWVDLRAGLDTETRGNILCHYRGSNPSRSVSSQTRYWLIYLSSIFHVGDYNWSSGDSSSETISHPIDVNKNNGSLRQGVWCPRITYVCVSMRLSFF
jgi:hypothetical protein